MDNYVVSARKYRPHTWEEVVGQSHITDTLQNAINHNHLAQALLFCGPRGVGKTTCARILANKINEATTGEGQDYSLNIFELDAASNNSVEDIRHLIDQVRFAPQVGQFKVYIIDEVHMLSTQAFNAFLKTLEEPPKHAIFILATTEKHKIIPTILSRCQIFDFKRIGVEDISKHLAYVANKEGITAEEQALHMIAQKADGALRDSLSIFDRIVSFSDNEITYQGVLENLNILDYDYYFKTVDFILENNIQGLLLLFDEILSKGFDGHQYLTGLASHFRDLLVSKDGVTLKLLEVSENLKPKYQAQSQACSLKFLMEALKVLNDADVRYKSSNYPRLLVELSLVQISESLHSPNTSGEKKNASREPNLTEKTFSTNQPSAPKPQPAPNYEPSSHPPKGETPKVNKVEEKGSVAPSRPKTPIKSLGNRLSLTGLKIKKEETKNTKEESGEGHVSGPTEVFTQKGFEVEWKKLVDQLKNQPKVYNTIEHRIPKLKENHQLFLELESQTQLDYFNEKRQFILNYLRKKLKNFAIDFEINIIQKEETQVPYTAQEKYKAMVAKNPLLKELKDTLNLDLE